jgi:hypothetical protein
VVLVAAGGCRIVAGCGCLQRTAAAALLGNGQCGVGLCLLHWHHGTTWLAADHGGLLSLARLSGAVHR